MTLKQLKESGKLLITGTQAARILGIDPKPFRETLKNNPEELPFPTINVNGKNYIKTISFIEIIKNQSEKITEQENQNVKGE